MGLQPWPSSPLDGGPPGPDLKPIAAAPYDPATLSAVGYFADRRPATEMNTTAFGAHGPAEQAANAAIYSQARRELPTSNKTKRDYAATQ